MLTLAAAASSAVTDCLLCQKLIRAAADQSTCEASPCDTDVDLLRLDGCASRLSGVVGALVAAGAPIAPATAQSGHRLLGAACDDARGLPAHALCTKHGACMGRCEVCERMLAFWHANGCRGSPCSDDRFGRGQKLKSTLDCWDAFTDMQRGGLLVESSPADEYRLQDCAQIRNVRKTCELWNFC